MLLANVCDCTTPPNPLSIPFTQSSCLALLTGCRQNKCAYGRITRYITPEERVIPTVDVCDCTPPQFVMTTSHLIALPGQLLAYCLQE